MKLQYPSMVINGMGTAINFKGSPQTWNIKSTDSTEHFINWVAKVATDSPSGLRSVFINAHGSNGYIHLGDNAVIRMIDIPLFARWKGKVDSIIFRVCHLASPQPSVPTKDMSYDADDPEAYNGDTYCRKLARASGATVFASNEYQTACDGREYDINEVDEWEGTVFTYKNSSAGVVREANFHDHVDTCDITDLPRRLLGTETKIKPKNGPSCVAR